MSQLYTVEKTIDDAIDALAEAIQPFCLECEIVRAQPNRAAMPIAGFVVLNEILSVDLSTPSQNNAQNGVEAVVSVPRRFDIQIDFYGPTSGDQCRAFSTVFKTAHMVSLFPDWIKPLYISDGVKAPLITGEQQWEERWIVTASLQFNSVITVPIQTATAIGLNIFDDIN